MHAIPVPSWPVSLWNSAPFSLSLVKFRPLAFLGISVEGCSWMPAILLSLSSFFLPLVYLATELVGSVMFSLPFSFCVHLAPLGSCSDSVLCLLGWIQFSCPGWDRSPFLIALNILCNDWFVVLSLHLGIASFILLYSNENAQYLEHQCSRLTPCENLGKVLAPFEQCHICLNKCSLLHVFYRFIYLLTLVKISDLSSFSFLYSTLSLLLPTPDHFYSLFDTWTTSLLLLLLCYSSCSLNIPESQLCPFTLNGPSRVVNVVIFILWKIFTYIWWKDNKFRRLLHSNLYILKLYLYSILYILTIVPLTFLLKGNRVLWKVSNCVSERPNTYAL